MTNAYDELVKEFPRELLAHNQAKKLTYIPIAEVIQRMNTVLGPENWNYEVVRIWREEDHPQWVLAHVRAHAYINGVWTNRDGFGGQEIKLKNKDKTPVDLGDEFKGAVSDALKKACQGFGVGLHLARKEEALRWEATEGDEVTETASAPAPVPAQQRRVEPKRGSFATESAPPAKSAPARGDSLYPNFKEMFDALQPEQQIALKSWWMETYPNVPPPSTNTPDEYLNRAIAQIVQIQLNATDVTDTAEANV